MPFTMRRFPVHCSVTYHDGLFQGQGIVWGSRLMSGQHCTWRPWWGPAAIPLFAVSTNACVTQERPRRWYSPPVCESGSRFSTT